MEKTINKNVDLTLFGQLKGINFEYLVQLNGLIEDYEEQCGADTLDEELVTFDITLNHVVKERIEELINAEKRVKEIVEEDRKKDNTVKYIKEAREYLEGLEGLEDLFNGKTVDNKCLEIENRLIENIYKLGSLETQTDVLKTLLETDIYKEDETIERATLASYLAMWEVVKEVEQEELDKNRAYISSVDIDDVGDFIDNYKLNANWNWCGWFMSNKTGLAHLDELFLVDYLEDEKTYCVIQNVDDRDVCLSYLLG